MPVSDVPYVAVLTGLQDDKPVDYGDPITIPGSEPVATAIAEAVRCATELHKKNRTNAMLVVSRGSAGVFMQTFDDESEFRSQ
jgi:hypothetical protein